MITTTIGMALIALPLTLLFGWMCHTIWILEGARTLAVFLFAWIAFSTSVLGGTYLVVAP